MTNMKSLLFNMESIKLKTSFYGILHQWFISLDLLWETGIQLPVEPEEVISPPNVLCSKYEREFQDQIYLQMLLLPFSLAKLVAFQLALFCGQDFSPQRQTFERIAWNLTSFSQRSPHNSQSHRQTIGKTVTSSGMSGRLRIKLARRLSVYSVRRVLIQSYPHI